MTLADIGFDGDWVSPIQKISNSRTGQYSWRSTGWMQNPRSTSRTGKKGVWIIATGLRLG